MLFNRYVVEPVRNEKFLLLMVGIVFLLANLIGYGQARSDARASGVTGRQSAIEIMQLSEAYSSPPVSEGNGRLATGNLYRSFFDSWKGQSAPSIIFDNFGVASFLCVFSLIPFTALVALYKEVEIGMMSGVAAGLNAAVTGHWRFFLAMPHFWFEAPAILLTTAMTVRSAIIVVKKKYGATIGIRIGIVYRRWLQALPLVITLFLVAGIIEANLTPVLVERLIAP